MTLEESVKQDLAAAGVSASVAAPGPAEPKRPRGRPKKKVEPELESLEPLAPEEWAALAEYVAPALTRLFEANRLSPPKKEQVAAVCSAWGTVVEKRAPWFAAYREEAQAVLLTMVVFGPLFGAMVQRRHAAAVSVGGTAGDGNGSPRPAA